MGIHGVRNLFEDNEPKPNDVEDHQAAGDGPHVLLPPLPEGSTYELTKLPSGRSAVIVTGEPKTEESAEENWQKKLETARTTCGCGKYQGCTTCGKYQGDDLNSPESRTLRHRD
jgi:hypothetical protein